ncbi:hypothetical protein JIG36_06455 [Actinoplanes sp. LDG1-06]|uniref:DprA winged helix domain-containing protein n=1 Tax=Paractinoplanes ovalisporus TaxID=2810368 RepID=A0ABS2A7A3_9ACTN|nr:hypothetical protein [Actinoplanes ovalisporus]MBM2615203.1 hypothetical protein [Actinoplanes ovalisporus]
MIFDEVLATLTDRRREMVEAAYALLENATEPVHRQYLPALGDATSQERLRELLRRTGRTLVSVDGLHFTSGFDDAVRAELTGLGWQPLPLADRAVLVLVLVYSVAIPRSEELISQDSWASPYPATLQDILRDSKVPATEARAALGRLTACGLLRNIRAGEQDGGYVPGPQLNRLTPAAREQLQDQLILAAAPDHPLAAAIRERRRHDPGDTR